MTERDRSRECEARADLGARKPPEGVQDVWRERRSCRGFLPAPIDRATLTRIFAAAQHAPSWCNVQPWHVALTEPPATRRLADAMVAAARSGFPHADVPFPIEYASPYKERRVECGVSLYKAMGIAREDKAGRYDAWLRNYAFFDAPHIAIVSCDKRLGPYAYVDVGVWLGYLLTAAAEAGVATCPMAAVAAYPEPLRAQLPIPADDVILFGVALGHRDDAAAANACRTTREPVEVNVTFVS